MLRILKKSIIYLKSHFDSSKDLLPFENCSWVNNTRKRHLISSLGYPRIKMILSNLQLYGAGNWNDWNPLAIRGISSCISKSYFWKLLKYEWLELGSQYSILLLMSLAVITFITSMFNTKLILPSVSLFSIKLLSYGKVLFSFFFSKTIRYCKYSLSFFSDCTLKFRIDLNFQTRIIRMRSAANEGLNSLSCRD